MGHKQNARRLPYFLIEIDSSTEKPLADVAQLVEHFHGKEKVRGSNPRIGSQLAGLV